MIVVHSAPVRHAMHYSQPRYLLLLNTCSYQMLYMRKYPDRRRLSSPGERPAGTCPAMTAWPHTGPAKIIRRGCVVTAARLRLTHLIPLI